MASVPSLAVAPRLTRRIDGASTSGRRALGSATPRGSDGRGRGRHRRLAPTTTTACLRCVRVARGRKPRVAPGRRREDVIHVSPRATDGDVNDGGEPDGDDVARTPRDGADGVGVGDGDGEDRADGPVVALALALIRFYRTQISPLTPPACRFVPTCSRYAMDAFRTFGAGRGSLLTFWRLARCTPFGGKGYDPPRWPPVAFNAGSWDDYPGINDPIPDDDADGR